MLLPILTLLTFSCLQIKATEVPRVKLNDGNQMPIIGLGTSRLSNSTYQAVLDAIEAGYRHFDSAALYGTEKGIGQALSHVFSTTNITRDEIWVTSKVWNNYHSRRNAYRSVQLSLENLNLNFLDLVLIHFPVGYKEGDDPNPVDNDGQVIYSDVDYLETWQGLEDAVAAGLVKSIGLSNFNSKQIERVLKNSRIKPAVLQIESHPELTQKPLIEFSKKKGITVTAYSPLGRGALIREPKLIQIGNNYNKTSAQVMIRYQIQRGVITIPKSSKKSRINENIDVFDFNLTDEDISIIESLNQNKRFITVEALKNHKYYPFNEPY